MRTNGHEVAAEVRFLRHQFKGTILIVEGPGDCSVLERFIDPGACQLQISFGKAVALEAQQLLEDDGFPGVLCLVDADFDRILATPSGADNSVLTDCHDLDLTMFRSTALTNVARQYFCRKKFADPVAAAKQVYDEITCLLAKFSCAKLSSIRLGLRVPFSKVDVKDFLTPDGTAVDVKAATVAALALSSVDGSNLQKILTRADVEFIAGHNLDQLISGHDFAVILGGWLGSRVGPEGRTHPSHAREVERLIRVGFDLSSFQSTQMFRAMVEWEASNRPYRILAAV